MPNNTWWLAINERLTSYAELKERRIAALFYPELTGLSSLLASAPRTRWGWENLVWEHHQAQDTAAPENMVRYAANALYFLLQFQEDDLVVALTGTGAVGMCRMPVDAVDGYRYDSTLRSAHIVADGVTWVDLSPADSRRLNAPSRGIQGARGLRKSADDAWSIWQRLDV